MYRDIYPGTPLQSFGASPPLITTYQDLTVTCGVSHTYYITAYNSCGESTPATTITNCATYEPWYQAKGGGVIAASGSVGTRLPPVSGTYLVLNDGSSNRPGMVGGTSASGNLSVSNSNSRSWLFNLNNWTTILSRQDNTFTGIRNKITARVQTPINISSPSNLTSAIDGANATNRTPSGVTILRATGPLVISGGSSINLGNRRALLIAENNVTIDSGITVGNGGFWGIISNGNISINPNIGEPTPNTEINSDTYPPHLTGIYYAQGTFSTGTLSPATDRQLRIDGTVIGISGVNLLRDVSGPYPSEFVNFRPDLTLILHQIGLRTKQIQELLIP